MLLGHGNEERKYYTRNNVGTTELEKTKVEKHLEEST
jgi:hypothetical protein